MIRIILATLVLSSGIAHAQEADGSARAEHGYAPPSDEPPPTPALTDEKGHPAGTPHTEHGGGHGDPSKHFRFFGNPFEHMGKDVAGGKLGDGKNVDPKTGHVVEGDEEPMSAPFIFAVVNFLILVFLLGKFGSPAARKMAAERHDQIKSALDEAAKLRKQAADKLAEYDSKLKAADAEIKMLVDGIRADADADKKRILEQAELAAAQMKRDAEQRIAAEIEYARAALTREVTAAAAAATEKLLREKMNAADQQKLVTSFIGDLQSKPSKEAR